MELKLVDPRALKINPDPSRRTPSTPASDAMMLASIKAVGIVQPPIVLPEEDGGNGYVIQVGHRRVAQAIKAEHETIAVLVADKDDHDAMKAMVENVVREGLNPVDMWRGIENLAAKGWTEDAIAVALSQTLRNVQKLRLLGKILPAMLDHMARGDLPGEQHLRTIASAPLDEQAIVWKKNKPKKGDAASWHTIASALTKVRFYARDASFDEEMAAAYGITWSDDLFAPADKDGRFTTDREAFLGAQVEWLNAHLPKRGVIVEASQYDEPKLPPKAQRVWGTAGKGDRTAHYIDRNGTIQSVAFRLPEVKKPAKGKGASNASGSENDDDVTMVVPRPDVTRNGVDMIGELRTDALRAAFERSPIEDDTLMALLVLALCGDNITIRSPHSITSGYRRMDRYAAALINPEGELAFDMDTLRMVARRILVETLSCRSDASNSGNVALIAGASAFADNFLPNMATEDFLSCLSRPALEGMCGKDNSVLPRQRVKDTRAALVEHYADKVFVHPRANFAESEKIKGWLASAPRLADIDAEEPETDDFDPGEFHDGEDDPAANADPAAPSEPDEVEFREAAE